MQVVERLLQQAAFRSEAAFSAARMLFCLAFGVRYFSTDLFHSDPSGGQQRALVLFVTAFPIVFSVAVLDRFRRGRLSMRWLAASVLLDAALCTLALGTNVVYPGSLYRGVLGIPDTGGLLVVMMSAGLRVSPRLALLGVVACSVGLLLLIVGDHTICPKPDLDYSLGTILLWPVFVLGAACFALLSAWRTRSLALYGAHESVRLERARQNLTSLLRSHHDAHALLSSATLNADMLLRDADNRVQVQRLAGDLRDDLSLLKDCVLELKQRADGELISALETKEVLVDDEVRQLAEKMAEQLAHVRLVTRTGAPGLAAVVAGGAQGLARILLNLLLNSRDARGARRTSQIWVETAPCERGARLTVRDDGPGFSNFDVAPSTTKLEGTGVGLAVVAAIAEASGGVMQVLPNHPHGARVDISLPARPVM